MTLPLGQQRHEHDLADGVRVVHVERWLSAADAAMALRRLEAAAWEHRTFRGWDHEIKLPRLTAWWGDKPYVYSGIVNETLPWFPLLNELRERVSDAAGHAFNAALGNLYRDGRDCVGWHADDEPDLEEDPIVASLSFGAARRFLMRRGKRIVEISLGHGDLLIMGRGCQRLWQHCVPRQASVTEPRISLTFRRML